MAIEKQESQSGLTKQRSSQNDDELRYFFPHQTFNSSLTSTTDAIITIDKDDEKATLEPKKKKQKLGSWWDDVESFNELSCVVKTKVDSCFSSTDLHETKKKKDNERSSLSSYHDNIIDLCEDESYSKSIASNHKENQDGVGYGHVALEDLGVSVEDLKSTPWEAFDPTWEIRSETMDPRLGGYVRDIISPMDSCFYSSTTGLHETKKEEDDHERSLSSSHHHDNLIDLSEEDESFGESSNKGNEHVSLEELGVSVEDLKSLPWEAFDPTWEIRSETMDPWLGGYVSYMSDLLINSNTY